MTIHDINPFLFAVASSACVANAIVGFIQREAIRDGLPWLVAAIGWAIAAFRAIV